jgi:hypothetical protein
MQTKRRFSDHRAERLSRARWHQSQLHIEFDLT